MRSFLRHFKFSVFGIALLCVALGAALLLWPDLSTQVICYAFGGILILSGLIQIAVNLGGERNFVRILLFLSGIIMTVVGVWVMFSPAKVLTLAVIVMGVVLLYHGAMDVKYAFDIKSCNNIRWAPALLFGLMTCGVGVLVLVNPFESARVLLTIVALGFIFDGLSDMFTVFVVARAERLLELAAVRPVVEIDPAPEPVRIETEKTGKE